MKILLVAATVFEIKPLLNHFHLSESNLTDNERFDVLITGVGMTATAFALGRQLSNSDYQLVLNLGIAGSFDKTLPLGMLVNVTHDSFAELGAEDQDDFLTIDALKLGKSKYSAIHNLADGPAANLKVVEGITVNTVHGSESSIATIRQRLSPTVESMEGASVLYCCDQLAMPCLQIRSISNYVEPRNKDTWQIALAVTNLNQWAIDFLTKT